MHKSSHSLSKSVVIDVDGASSGNPGQGAAAWVIHHNGTKTEQGVFLGKSITNNEAEYWAVIYALVEALYRGFQNVVLHSDSQLVVHQLHGLWKIREPRLQPLYQMARYLIQKTQARIEWIPRENNHANTLAQRIAQKGPPNET